MLKEIRLGQWLAWGLGIVLCFAYYYNVPLWGDDWFYGTVREFQEIYTLKKGWHPGRNFTEFLHIFPSKILGTILGFAIGDTLKGVRLVHAAFSTAITLGLYVVATFYINKPFRFISLVMLALSSFYLHKIFVEFTITSQLWGAMVFSLIAWLPLAHFFLHGALPPWFEKKPHQYLGIWLALIYAGTQVFDVCAWLIAGLAVFTLFYLHVNKSLSYAHKKYVAYLAYAIVIFTLFALFRDTVLSDYGQQRVSSLGLKYGWFIELTSYVKATLILGLGVLVWYTRKNIQLNFSDRAVFYPWALLAVGYSILIFSASIITTYADLSIFLIWIGLLQAMSYFWSEEKPLLHYILPTLMLGLVLGSVNNFTQKSPAIHVSRREFITQRINERTIALYQRAESEGKNILEVTESLADEMSLAFRGMPVWLEYMSIWMNRYGYTQKVIPVVIVPDPPANEKNPELEAVFTNTQ